MNDLLFGRMQGSSSKYGRIILIVWERIEPILQTRRGQHCSATESWQDIGLKIANRGFFYSSMCFTWRASEGNFWAIDKSWGEKRDSSFYTWATARNPWVFVCLWETCHLTLTVASSLWSGPSAISLTSDSQIPSCLVALPALQLKNSAMRMRSLVFSLWKSHPTAKDWWVTPNSVAGRRVVWPSTIGSTNQLLFTKEPVTLLAGETDNVTKLSSNTHHEAVGRGV